MKEASALTIICLCRLACQAATFGTVVPVTGGATDLVLDESRGRLYIVDTTQNRIDVYSTAQKRFLNPIPVGTQPLSAAISRDGTRLYVTIFLLRAGGRRSGKRDRGQASEPARLARGRGGGRRRARAHHHARFRRQRRGKPAASLRPEPDRRGRSAGGCHHPARAHHAHHHHRTSSRVYMSTRSNLTASADGSWIVGLDNPTTSSRQVFVYEVASGSVLRSRTLTSISTVLSVSPDGARFMGGLSLFDTATLAIAAQQNTANSVYPFASNANFSTRSNQGGSVFAPDMSVVYSAFNVAPVPGATGPQANTSQIMLSDPDNLLISLGLQLPENLAGKMVITSDGATVYAMSQSGVVVLPVSTIYDNPIAVPEVSSGSAGLRPVRSDLR